MIKDLLHLPILIGFFFIPRFPALLIICLVCYLIVNLELRGGEKAPNARADFGELRTFRDLSELIARRAVFQA